MNTDATHYTKSPLKKITNTSIRGPILDLLGSEISSRGTPGPPVEGPGSSMGPPWDPLADPRDPKDLARPQGPRDNVGLQETRGTQGTDPETTWDSKEPVGPKGPRDSKLSGTLVTPRSPWGSKDAMGARATTETP